MNLSNKKVLIVTNGFLPRSETFVRAHIQHLSGTKFVLHEAWVPRVDNAWPHPYAYIDLPYRIFQHWRGGIPTSSWYNKHIFNEIRRVKPDVVFIEYGTTAGMIVDALEQCRLPYIVHFHGHDASVDLVLKRYADRYRRLASSAAAVIAVSRSMQDNLIKSGFLKEKVHYCPCGVEASKFETQANPHQAAPLFLTTGRFVDKKAPYLSLLAFSKVLRNFPEAKLIMIGDGPLKKICQELAFNVLKVGDSVQFMGTVAHSIVVEHLYKIRGFVQHSIQAPSGNCEGTPVAVMEAMMAGLPVVATRHAGIADIIEHKKTGFLVEEGDIAEMARWMCHLIKNPFDAAEVGKEARKAAMKEHCMINRIRELESIIYGAM